MYKIVYLNDNKINFLKTEKLVIRVMRYLFMFFFDKNSFMINKFDDKYFVCSSLVKN